MDLNSSLARYGFNVFHNFPRVPYVDIVVESEGFSAAIEICKRCSMRNIDQVLKGAGVLRDVEGIEANALIVFSYTGE